MQITIAGGQGAEAEGSSRKVARDVDMENFTVLDQVSKKHNFFQFISIFFMIFGSRLERKTQLRRQKVQRVEPVKLRPQKQIRKLIWKKL